MAVELVAGVFTAAIHLLQDDSDPEEDPEDIAVLITTANKQMSQKSRPKIYGYVENVVPLYDDTSFRRMFRMSRPTYEVLCGYLKNCPELQTDGRGKEPISVEKQLLLTMWYVGSQSTIHTVADRFGISESTAIICRNKIIAAIINNLLPRFIHWPSMEKCREESNKFSQRNGFPGIVGAIDGTHIRIKAPKEHPKSYVNRKKFHSIQLQAVCNSDMIFTHIYTGYPGSVHDARVLRLSDLWSNGLQMCNMLYHIIGDGGYPIRRWLLTPYRDNGHLNEQEKRYNKNLSSNRVVIERAFALLKGRFRRLQYLDTKTVETAVDIIMVCCILHNICILNHDDVNDFIGEPENDDDDNDELPLGQVIQENDAEGMLKRNNIARNLN